MCEKARPAQPDGLVGRPYKLAVLALCLVNVAHFYSIASLFAYAGFLAVDNGWAEDEDSAGFVVGVLAIDLHDGRGVLRLVTSGILSAQRRHSLFKTCIVRFRNVTR